MDEGLPQEKLCRGPLLHENFIFFHTFRRRWECNTICAVAGDGVMHLFHEREKIQKDEGWLCCSCRKTEFFDLFCLQKPSGFLIDFVRRNPAAFCLFCSQNPEGVLLDWFIKKGYLMSKIIFCGHGCYGEYFKMAFKMLLGETEDLYFVNFLPSEDSSQLLENLKKEIEKCGDGPILFIADLLGGLPFKQCALLCMEHENNAAIAGIGLGVALELVGNKEKSPKELVKLAQIKLEEAFDSFPKSPFLTK